jgi:hypothetical protein
MEQIEFNSAEKVTEYVSNFLRQRFPKTSLPPEALSLVARDMSPIWEELSETVRPARSRPAHVASFKWVIRNDDLKLLDSVLDGLKASAGVGFFILAGVTVTGGTVAAAGILAGFLKLAYNAASKGAILSTRNYSIIATLFGQPAGLTDQEILDRLLTTEPSWTIEEIREGLTMLSEIPSRSGKISLVWKSADAQWRTTGV